MYYKIKNDEKSYIIIANDFDESSMANNVLGVENDPAVTKLNYSS